VKSPNLIAGPWDVHYWSPPRILLPEANWEPGSFLGKALELNRCSVDFE
jgi:hypothetical protein